MRILIDDATGSKAASARAAGRTRGGAAAEQIAVACRRTGGDKECACAGVDLCDQPEHASAVLDALGVALMNRGCLEEGAKLVERALRIRRKFFGDDHPTTALSLNSYARVLRERGELTSAEQVSQTALRINRAAYGGDALPVAVSLYELGVVQLNQGAFAQAEATAIEGLRILRKLGLDDTDPHTTRLMDIRGRAETARGAYEAANATYDALLKLDRAQVGQNHPKYATHLANAANVKEAQGLHKQAETAYLRAIDVYAKRLKRRCHPNLIDMYASLGSLYLSRNSKPSDMREAARYLNEALRLNLKVRGPVHVLVANDYANLGRLRYLTEDRRGALQLFFTALKIYDRNVKRGAVAETHPFLAEALTWTGRLLVEGGSRQEAERARPFIDRALSIWAVSGEAGKVGKAAAEASLGRALHLQGEREQSRTLLMQAYDVLSEALGEDYPFVQIVRGWLDELGLQAQAA